MSKISINNNITGQIFWLASYPKSGNTWVRFLLINLLFGNQESSQNFELLLPDIHNKLDIISIMQKTANTIKSHLVLDSFHPLLEKTIGYIYIIRNPINVMLSNYNYYLLNLGKQIINLSSEEKNTLKTTYINEYLKNKGFQRWIELGMGNWESNVKSWIENTYNFPNLVIKYEDLLENPHHEVKKICDFIGLQPTTEQLNKVIENSSFENMKKIEENDIAKKIPGFFYKSYFIHSHEVGIRFMNKGKNRNHKLELTAEQLNKTKELFYPLMEKFNYL